MGILEDLFAGGKQGYLSYSGLEAYTDTAGTVPAQPGDPVALMKDLSGNGNDRVMAEAHRRPILTRWPKSGRRNLLDSTNPENWDRIPAAAPFSFFHNQPDGLGGNTATLVSFGAVDGGPNGEGVLALTRPTGPGEFTIRVRIRGNNGTTILVTMPSPGGPNTSYTHTFTGQWEELSVTRTEPEAGIRPAFYFIRYPGTTASLIFISHAQDNAGPTPMAFQPVNSRYDITEAGQPDCYGLWYDGTDDYMETEGAVDFAEGRKVTIISGVSKLAPVTGITAFFGNPGAGPPWPGRVALSVIGPGHESGWGYTMMAGASGTDGLNRIAMAPPNTRQTPSNNVVAGLSDMDAPYVVARVNSEPGVVDTNAYAAAGLGAATLYTGRGWDVNALLNGIEWGLAVLGDIPTEQDLLDAEAAILANTPGVVADTTAALTAPSPAAGTVGTASQATSIDAAVSGIFATASAGAADATTVTTVELGSSLLTYAIVAAIGAAAGAIVAASSVSAAASVGSVTQTTNNSASVTGVGSVAHLGEVSAAGGAIASLVSEGAQGQVGSTDAGSVVHVDLDGVAAEGAAAEVSVAIDVAAAAAGLPATAWLEPPLAYTDILITVSGMGATTATHDIIVRNDIDVYLVGLEATLHLGVATTWGRLVIDADDGWTDIHPHGID